MLGAQKKLVGWILALNKIYLMKRLMMVKRIPVRYKMAPTTRVRTLAASLTLLGFPTHKSQVQTRNIRHLQAAFKYQ